MSTKSFPQILKNWRLILPLIAFVGLSAASPYLPSAHAENALDAPTWTIKGTFDCIMISHDEKMLAIAAGNKQHEISVWNIGTRKRIQRLQLRGAFVTSLAFSGDNNSLAIGANDSSIRLWNIQKNKINWIFKGIRSGKSMANNAVMALAFSPDWQMLAAGFSNYEEIPLLNAQSGSVMRRLKGHTGSVDALAFAPSGKSLASGSYNGEVNFWNARTGNVAWKYKQYSPIYSLVWSPDSKHLSISSQNTTLQIRDAKGMLERQINPQPTWGFCDMATFSLDSNYWVKGATDAAHATAQQMDHALFGKPFSQQSSHGYVNVYNLKTGRLVGEVKNIKSVTTLSLSAKGTLLAVSAHWTNSGPALRLWRMR